MATVTLRPKDPKPPRGENKPFRGFSLDAVTDAQIDALAAKYGLSRSALIVEIVGQVYRDEFPDVSKSSKRKVDPA